MEGAKISPGEPSRTNKYVIVLDDDSDADTQNGADGGHPQNIVETEVVRKEAIIEQSEQKKLVDRKEASTSSPEVKVFQQEDTKKFVTKSESISLGSQDTYEVDFLEVGSDGHEDKCHLCGNYGTLLCCDGCPIAMHFDCIKGLGLIWPRDEDEGDWYCPVCLSLKAARKAAEAEMAAVLAREKLKAFKMESKRRRQEKAVNQSRPRIRSMQPGENDRFLKPKEEPSDDGPKLRYTEGQQPDSDPCKASLLPNVLRNALHQRDLHHSSPVQSNRVISLGQVGENAIDIVRAVLRAKKQLVNASPKLLVTKEAGSIRYGFAMPVSAVKRLSHESQPSQDVSRRDPLAASTSGQVRRESERSARFAKRKEPEQAGAGIPEPGNQAGGHRNQIPEQMRTRSMSRAGKNSKGGDGVPEALLYALPYVGAKALQTLEAVSRELRNAVRGDATLWQHLHVDGSLSKRLTETKLRKMARRAKGRMLTLGLPNCTWIPSSVVWDIVVANPLLHKLDLSGCVGVTARAVLAMVRMQAARHAPGLTKLRIQGLRGVSPEMLDAIQTTMQVTNYAPHSPQYYSHGKLISPAVSDERPLDLEACPNPNCRKVATVFDCPLPSCKQHRCGPLQECRACYYCLVRCEECGACVAGPEEGAEETFCGDFLCKECEEDAERCSECCRAGCSRHLEANGFVDNFTHFTCNSCQDDHFWQGDN